jgi:methionyl-tRNA formyltransferase
MKIIFISGVKFGHDILHHVLVNNWKVSAIFSYDDSKRKFYSDIASFDEISKMYGIRHIKVNNINDQENIKIIKEIQPDLILVMGWSQIIQKEILEIPKLGVIGSHPTLLPKYRGRAPIPWSIIKNLPESGLTFFYMAEGTDDGDILDQTKFEISYNDDASTLYDKITILGKNMLVKNLSLLESGTAKRIKQDNSKFIEYWPKRTPEDGKIDWSKDGKDVHALIRATTHPYPGAYTFFKKSKLIIWKAKLLEGKYGEPGKIIAVNDLGTEISTKKGNILLEKVSMNEGDKISSLQVFSKDDVGELLG